MIIWIFPVYEITDKIFRVNKFRKITQSKDIDLIVFENIEKKEQYRIEIPLTSSLIENSTRKDLENRSENNISSESEILSNTSPSSTLTQNIPSFQHYSYNSIPDSSFPLSNTTTSFSSANNNECISFSTPSPTMFDNDLLLKKSSLTHYSKLNFDSNEKDKKYNYTKNISLLSSTSSTLSSSSCSTPSLNLPQKSSNLKFWILTTIGRLCAIAVIAIPSLTPAKEKFGFKN
jgi:hypothetical protein